MIDEELDLSADPEVSAEPVPGMDQLETLQAAEDHPMLTTPFEDYTVTEGLLLLLFLCVFLSWCAKLLKGGFSWLLW